LFIYIGFWQTLFNLKFIGIQNSLSWITVLSGKKLFNLKLIKYKVSKVWKPFSAERNREFLLFLKLTLICVIKNLKNIQNVILASAG